MYDLVNARKVNSLGTTIQMVKRKHRVGFPTAEVSLQLDNGITLLFLSVTA